MKNKYTDNRLAEEFGLIVLTNDAHLSKGLPTGSLGTLTYSYTGLGRPMYGEFELADGERVEEPLKFRDFRVLDEKNERDLSLIMTYLLSRQPLKRKA